MNEPKQSSLFEKKRGGVPRRVLYVPPDAGVMQKLAGEVCKTLRRKGGAAFHTPEVIDGLGDYLNVVARLTANSLTKGKANWTNPKSRKQP